MTTKDSGPADPGDDLVNVPAWFGAILNAYARLAVRTESELRDSTDPLQSLATLRESAEMTDVMAVLASLAPALTDRTMLHRFALAHFCNGLMFARHLGAVHTDAILHRLNELEVTGAPVALHERQEGESDLTFVATEHTVAWTGLGSFLTSYACAQAATDPVMANERGRP